MADVYAFLFDSTAYYLFLCTRFFKTEPPPKTLGPQTEQIKDFIQIQKQQGRLIALLTSGGTVVSVTLGCVPY